MRTEGSVEIDRSIDDVFRLTTDRVADWSAVVVEQTILERKPEGVGTTLRTVTEDHGRRMEFHGEVTRHEPPRASAIRMTGQQFDLDVEYVFEDLGGGRTRVTQRSEVRAKGLLRVVFALFGPLMRKSSCKALAAELERLKRYCEQER